MKIFFILVSSLLISIAGSAQSSAPAADQDTLAPYQKTPFIPSFSILTPDSTWFRRVDLAGKKPTLILYFSPDCGHCQSETEEIIGKMKDLKNLQIVMITSRPYEDMLAFAERYKLNRFRSIKIGADPSRMVTRFYDVKFTPFSALYDKKGKLVKVYKSGIDMAEMIATVNE